MADKYFKQFVYNSFDEIPLLDENDQPINILKISENLKISDVYHLGIQGYPGLKFQINALKNNNQTPLDLIIGNTGLFEIDLEGSGSLINSIVFSSSNTKINLPNSIIVDVLYYAKENVIGGQV